MPRAPTKKLSSTIAEYVKTMCADDGPALNQNYMNLSSLKYSYFAIRAIHNVYFMYRRSTERLVFSGRRPSLRRPEA